MKRLFLNLSLLIILIAATPALAQTSPTAKTVLLIDVLLKDEGHTREDFSEEQLHKRFSTTAKQFRRASKELKSIE